ncbi:heme oxygenase (biliverdin-producing) [Lysobacter korlensis]|uniref:Heme oxygenase (Biliverdin-producing) n=1 Tax=Lysobacter korlensis TaxID=553636 RepID=A0ABV6RYL6_9GAMM
MDAARRETAPVSDVATLLRQASAEDHRATESRPFLTRLVEGSLSLDAYARYLGQLRWVYDALESRPCGDVDVFDARLRRRAAIESDLAALGVEDADASHPPLPATARYAAHLSALAGSPNRLDSTVRYLAHHYTRYLGDLSGGQAVAALVARHYGAAEHQLAFARFPELGPVVDAKRRYRERLNSIPLDETEVDELVREVRVAFAFNAAIFDELAA